MEVGEKRYLELLSRSFPTIAEASAEVINLSAILNLPKSTEFFASDIHGEFEAFSHILRNGSGSIRLKVDDVFGDTLSDAEKRALATLIYYPREKAKLVLSQVEDEYAWYAVTVPRLVAVCKRAARKYTHSKIRRAVPSEFAYIVEELLTEDRHGVDKEAYYSAIIDAAVRTGRGIALIEALSTMIQRLAVDQLHIIGDIYDRGPAPHTIMDTLMAYHSVDIQWGNHDIVWMGASLGQRGCIAHVVRNCAMAIIQFKVEGQLIDENPAFGLDDRKLLDKIDYARGTVMLDGTEYELTDKVFPTIDPNNPYALTPAERDVMERLVAAFTGCEKLRRHMQFFLEAGSLYKVHNGNLLFHACVPLNADGSLKEVDVYGKTYKGRALYDVMERHVRAAFFSRDEEERRRGRDMLWYLWLGQGSPLFAKSKMATFELYLIADKAARKEMKNPFYTLIDDEAVVANIFRDFGLDPETSHIICGHVPVKVKDGEDPVKCGGKVIMIDGGFSKAYQPTTGIAGYALISNSYGFILAAHEPLESAQAAIEKEIDIHSSRHMVEQVKKRTLMGDTDEGQQMKREIADLERLLKAYRTGEIPRQEQKGE